MRNQNKLPFVLPYRIEDFEHEVCNHSHTHAHEKDEGRTIEGPKTAILACPEASTAGALVAGSGQGRTSCTQTVEFTQNVLSPVSVADAKTMSRAADTASLDLGILEGFCGTSACTFCKSVPSKSQARAQKGLRVLRT